MNRDGAKNTRSAQINMLRLLKYTFSLLLLCGCATKHSDISSKDAVPVSANATFALPRTEAWGSERVLTNAHVAVWLPSRTAQIREGRVTSVNIDKTSPRGARFVSGEIFEEFKISSSITIMTDDEFQYHTNLFKGYDDHNEHPSLAMFDRPIGRVLRRDIRDSERGRVISILFIVHVHDAQGRENGTFQQDIETAKRIVESVRLLKAQPDETDFLNPLTMTKVEQVKKRINDLQPYMTPKDCVVALGLPIGKLGGSDSGPGESQRISLQLREGRVLLLACDRRGYVISAQLDDAKWEWKKDEGRH